MKASHVICIVDNLAQAVADYEAVGFTVEWGDRQDKAQNALIWFEHGPFLELLTRGAGPPKLIAKALTLIAPNGMMRRFNEWNAQPQGWCDIAVECDGDVRPELEAIGSGIGKIAGPFSTKRTPPGGQEIVTQTAFPHNASLPLLMGAYRPDPRPVSVHHANGATGIASIVIDIPQTARDGWARVLDANDPWIDLQEAPVASAVTKLGVREVTLHGLQSDVAGGQVCGAVLKASS